MKKIILLITLMLAFIGCGKEEFEGKWISKNWKENPEWITITKNEKDEYLLKIPTDSSYSRSEGDSFSATKKNDILKINIISENFGIIMDVIIDKSNNDLILDKERYVKIDKEFHRKMESHVKKLKSEIIGSWIEKKEMEEDWWVFVTEGPEVYKWEITSTPKPNMINIKRTDIKNKSEKEDPIKVSEGVFSINPQGKIEETTEDFLGNYNVEDIKNFQKIK